MIDLTGKTFCRLTVIESRGVDKRGEMTWLCRCECGNEKVVKSSKLRSGNTKSCGCLQRETRKQGNHKTHGKTNDKIYVIWCNMRSRCYNQKNIMFKNYGGRGIKVCDEWKNSFENFYQWAIANGYTEGLSIERKNVNGNYEPSNCAWITKEAQYLNRTDSHKITAFGKTQTIKEWADETGIKYDTIERRINAYGWDAERALTTKR